MSIQKICFSICILGTGAMMAQQLYWGLAARQGDRVAMEDEHTHILNFGDVPTDAFFAIYDGHGGKEAATYAHQVLHTHFLKNIKAEKSIQQSLIDAFEQTDQEILKLTESGSTALVCYIHGDEAYIAWSGDSRALVIREGAVIFKTKDHKPNAPAEKERLESKGLVVTKYFPARVRGLAISRTLGDKEVKDVPGSIIATPEVEKVILQPDDVILLACDGVWDELGNQRAACLISAVGAQEDLQSYEKMYTKTPYKRNKKLDAVIESGDNKTAELAARVVRDAAYDQGSTDNISALVVLYHPLTPKARKEALKRKEEQEQAAKKRLIIDRLEKLKEVVVHNDLPEIAYQVANILAFVRSQPHTVEKLSLVADWLDAIDMHTKIAYDTQVTTLAVLLEPVMKTIDYEIDRLMLARSISDSAAIPCNKK